MPFAASGLRPQAPAREVDRYIAWPGQALAYKLGQLEILALREQARQKLGPKFDLRAFHDEVLSAGALPLDTLRSQVTAWIEVKEKQTSLNPNSISNPGKNSGALAGQSNCAKVRSR